MTGAAAAPPRPCVVGRVPWLQRPHRRRIEVCIAVAVAAAGLLAGGPTSAPGGEAVSAASSELHGDHLRKAFGTGCGLVAVLLLLHALQRRQKESAAGLLAHSGAAGAPPTWQGADVGLLAICLAVGWTVRFVLPIPAGVTEQAWSMLAIFVAMICAVVTGPLPPAAVSLAALAVATGSKTVTFAEGLSAFTDEVVWLVLLAFFFAEGFQKTGLGDRMALSIIQAVGGTVLGLAYGLGLAELLVALAMPSSAARAAAVFYPITLGVCRASGSEPAHGTRMKCGAFLVECCYQATSVSSNLFLSGAAQNYFVLKLAAGVGVEVPSPFQTWTLAAAAPAVVSFLLAPVVAFHLFPPEATRTPDAPKVAAQRLQAMGPMSDDEKVFGAVMLGMVAFWATASSTGIQPVVTAVCGLALLQLTGVITWEDCARNGKAWGTFVSFASLVGLASMLNRLGIVRWIASSMTERIADAGLGAVPAFFAVALSYWVVHYMFASQVAHVSALYQPFLLMLVQTGTPPVAAALALAFISNLFMTMTPYASAQSAVIMGGQYITVGEWYKAGFAYFVFYAIVWASVGSVWWKLIGLI